MNSKELELGIFARVFPPGDARALAGTIRRHGLRLVHLNLVAVGLPTIPDVDEMSAIDLGRIATAFQAAGLVVWGVSATYNMAYPDDARRRAETHRAAAFVPRIRDLGTSNMTVCSGTRDPRDKWRAHPDNGTPDAWDDMIESFSVLADAAISSGVKLVVEPEPGNVITGTDLALRLVSDLGSRGEVVRFVLDPANLVARKPISERSGILEDARLGDRTVCLHAKDVIEWDERLGGEEGLDFVHVMRLRMDFRVRSQ